MLARASSRLANAIEKTWDARQWEASIESMASVPPMLLHCVS